MSKTEFAEYKTKIKCDNIMMTKELKKEFNKECLYKNTCFIKDIKKKLNLDVWGDCNTSDLSISVNV